LPGFAEVPALHPSKLAHMLIAALSALVLQVAPAHYDAKFSCDCQPNSTDTSGTLTTRAKTGGDFDFDYPKAGVEHLDLALRAGRQIIADSPGLQASNKWHSSVNEFIQDQTFAVPVDVFIVGVEDGVATIEARGELEVSVQTRLGTIPVSSNFDLIEHIKLGQTADELPSLTSLVETVVNHYQRGPNGLPFEATYKCELAASEATPKPSQ